MLIWERGSKDKPRGRAVIYWSTPSGYYASYLAIPPFDINPEYVKQFAPSNVREEMEGKRALVTPITPPFPIDDIDRVKRRAEENDDDILNAGMLHSLSLSNIEDELAKVADEYCEYWSRTQEIPSKRIEIDKDEAIYSILSNEERLRELSRLIGAFREGYAVESDLRKLMKYIDKVNEVELMEATRVRGKEGIELCELYLMKYRMLYSEDYRNLKNVEDRIKAIWGSVFGGDIS